jgi:hypothetical protein
MSIEEFSAFGRWKASCAAITWRYRTERGLCQSCGRHPAGEWCDVWKGVAPADDPEWVQEILDYYQR